LQLLRAGLPCTTAKFQFFKVHVLESTTDILTQAATTSRLSDDTAYIPVFENSGFTPFLVRTAAL